MVTPLPDTDEVVTIVEEFQNDFSKLILDKYYDKLSPQDVVYNLMVFTCTYLLSCLAWGLNEEKNFREVFLDIAGDTADRITELNSDKFTDTDERIH